MKTICAECGSDNVSTRQWLNLKTGCAESISDDPEDNYCDDCEEHVNLITEVEF